MCHMAIVEFFIENAELQEFNGKRVLEIGSRYVNGSVRPLIERHLSPKEYVGIDVETGKHVDLVLPAERIVNHFGISSFDVVVATELLEHVVDWRLVVYNIKTILKPWGILYVTTRSRGFPYHAYPYDFWRYEVDDFKRIFNDFELVKIEMDHQSPGLFLKARKLETGVSVDLADIAIYSMMLGRRTTEIPDIGDFPFTRRVTARFLGSWVRWLLPLTVLNLLERACS